MSEVHPITFRLKVYNAWRRGNDAPQPDPKTVGEDIDSICDLARRLERERDELKTQLIDAKSSTAFWIGKAGKADEAANDLVAELEDIRGYWKEEAEGYARLLGMSAERECDLRGKVERLERERDEARNAMAQAQGELDLKTLDFERMREQRDQLSKQLKDISKNIQK